MSASGTTQTIGAEPDVRQLPKVNRTSPVQVTTVIELYRLDSPALWQWLCADAEHIPDH